MDPGISRAHCWRDTLVDPCTSLPLLGPQVVYCASVGSYFKGGQLTPIDLIVENHFHR